MIPTSILMSTQSFGSDGLTEIVHWPILGGVNLHGSVDVLRPPIPMLAGNQQLEEVFAAGEWLV